MSEGELNKRQHIGDEAIFMADAFTEFPAIFFFSHREHGRWQTASYPAINGIGVDSNRLEL